MGAVIHIFRRGRFGSYLLSELSGFTAGDAPNLPNDQYFEEVPSPKQALNGLYGGFVWRWAGVQSVQGFGLSGVGYKLHRPPSFWLCGAKG